MKKDTFPKDFLEDSQTEFSFIPSHALPKDLSLTAVLLLCFQNDNVLLVHVPRGWGIVAGHIEKGETAEEAAKREALEEAGITINSLNLIGYLKAKKYKKNKLNSRYPLNSAIPVFVSKDFLVSESVNLKHESINRKFVTVNKLNEDPSLTKMMKAIMNYAYQMISKI